MYATTVAAREKYIVLGGPIIERENRIFSSKEDKQQRNFRNRTHPVYRRLLEVLQVELEAVEM